jgi:hypothetical protein
MKRTAEAFIEESKFYPVLKSCETNIQNLKMMEDILVSSWWNYYTSKQNFLPPHSTTSTCINTSTSTTPTSCASSSCPREMYRCTYPNCKGVFSSLPNLKRHEKLHKGLKPHQCTVEGCGKSFARKYDLKVHLRTHTKEKPYVCSFENCTKRFSRISGLREHERKIHGLASKKLKSSPTSTEFDAQPHLDSHSQFSHNSTQLVNSSFYSNEEDEQSLHSNRRMNEENNEMNEENNEMNEDHEHRIGCGHVAVIHDGHADFLIPDVSGVSHLEHIHHGKTLQHVLKDNSANPIVCAPVENGHQREHLHGKDCGHEAILHEDHVDYIVDNLLHHFHGDHW